jgi:hypothetical protein
MNQDAGALTKKLATTTAGIASNAEAASAGIIRTRTMPTPKATALAIMNINKAI